MKIDFKGGAPTDHLSNLNLGTSMSISFGFLECWSLGSLSVTGSC